MKHLSPCSLLGLLGAILLTHAAAFGQFYNRPVADTATAQGVRYRVALGGIAASNGTTPFWIRSNQFGTIPFNSPTGLASVGAVGIWGDPTQRRPYLKAGVEVVANLNGASRLVLPEAYAAIRFGHGELYVGRRKEINGLTDTLLTSGSVAWSGNALPITQIRLGTNGFAPLKMAGGLFAVNAFISHGWFANTDSMRNVKLHAKSVFLRIGKPNWKVRFYGGINHFVQWGGDSPYLPSFVAKEGHIASDWNAYKNVVWPVGAVSGNDGQISTIDSLNQVGNHLGSIDMGMDVQFARSNLYLYYQHIYEDGSGVKFQNFPDGLFGIRWRKDRPSSHQAVQLKQLTVEFLTSINRSGTSPIYGRDNYFFNGQYIEGWVQQKNVIGTPIFTRTNDLPNDLRYNNEWFNRKMEVTDKNKPGWVLPVNNNAVQTVHLGLYALVSDRIPVVLLVTANRYYEWPNTKKYYDQLYTSLEVNNLLRLNASGLQAGVKLAFDSGRIFSSNLGGMLTIRKEGFFR
ncbi:capsule assembly Wzi family protein [Fibrella aquatilis]|uniref:Capsule assembly protein Wzi n=1 Tax=Fibrella aquatilis TaxID=2817059 RepID=A0A939GAA6_9BACT|nr:capsule assembly Wzi family protein [Fibrella aquatilis]MBO0933195.1 hypothetical protein [Fibrella aquatilis]